MVKLICKFVVASLCFALICSVPCSANQDETYKKRAIEAFKNEDYNTAIGILKEAVKAGHKDAETYYYLGYFSHYLSFDTRPFVTIDHLSWSDSVVWYLEEALRYDAEYGDAYYFLGTEYSSRAWFALYEQNVNRFIQEYTTGHAKGGFPEWQLEFGRNILHSCEEDAILFLGGDFDYNAVKYLQAIEKFRTDVSAIPIGYLDRPWYIKTLKNGLDPIIRSVPISLSEYDIYDIRNYKWDTLDLKIPIYDKIIQQYGLESDHIFIWSLEPDLLSENRTYLSPRRAILADIIEANNWQRPMHFAMGCAPQYLAGLDVFFQINGMTSKLLPFETHNTSFGIDHEKTSKVMMDKNNFVNFHSIETSDMPRVSRVMRNYYVALIELADYYFNKNQYNEIGEIIEFIETNLVTTKIDYQIFIDYINEHYLSSN